MVIEFWYIINIKLDNLLWAYEQVLDEGNELWSVFKWGYQIHPILSQPLQKVASIFLHKYHLLLSIIRSRKIILINLFDNLGKSHGVQTQSSQ